MVHLLSRRAMSTYVHGRLFLVDASYNLQSPSGICTWTMLFLLFINDLSVKIGTAAVDIYTDDTTSTAACDWSRSLGRVVDWSSENKLAINQYKTKMVLFASKRLRSKLQSHDQELNITLPGSDKPLSQVKSQKLLGVVLDQELNFDELIESLSKKVLKRIGLFLPYEERINYYLASIRPIIMYGSSVWTLCVWAI